MILVGIVGLLAILVVFFGAAFAVPVTIVFSAIYLLPPLSFILAWPPEVIAAITMPFVVLWVILLVELSGWKSTEQAHEKKTRFRRVGRFINNVLDVVITFLYRIVDRLRSSQPALGWWSQADLGLSGSLCLVRRSYGFRSP